MSADRPGAVEERGSEVVSGDGPPPGEAPATKVRGRRRKAIAARVRGLVRAIDAGDDAKVEQAVIELSQSRRWLAPLALLVGAFTMLFQALKLLVSNWRLTLVEILPAMWIWVAMLDLKIHMLHGKSFHVLRGPILIPLIAVVAGITAASFYLNAVFAFAVARPGKPEIGAGFAEARRHLRTVLTSGLVVGVCLGVATLVFPRWSRWWFAVSLSIVVGVMMWSYVAIPSRLLGAPARTGSRRDKLSASAIAGLIGAIVCTPPYTIGRVGILMLGTHWLFVLGVVFIAVGITLQAGATGAVKAIKMSAKLAVGRHPATET
ncbi:MAG TPA: hypothetical protein VMU09_02760 [Acidimicrobiales bacterium]|nr:hypothetical protein [Acidimicrobiales bacterium]